MRPRIRLPARPRPGLRTRLLRPAAFRPAALGPAALRPAAFRPAALRSAIRRPAAPPASATAASDTVTRVLCLAVAAAATIFGLLIVDSFREQLYLPMPKVAIGAFILSFGLPVALGLLSAAGASRRVLAGIALAEAVVFITIALFWIVMRADPLPAGRDIPWTITFTGVAAVAVATFFGGRLAWSYVCVAAALSGVVRFVTSAEPRPVLVGLGDAFYSLLLVSVFVAFTLAARRAAATVDTATVFTRQATAQRAERVARRQERLRIDALVHDSVISTLLMAGLGRTPPAVVAENAVTSVAQLDALQHPPVQPVVLVSDVLRRVRRLTQQIAPDAPVHVDDSHSPGVTVERTVPAAAVTALLGALGEALRNSVSAAAGPPRPGPARVVRRSVTVLSTSQGFQLTVHDDGVGFTPAAVPPERLGIAQSIVGRMQQLPGGAAHVRSHPGGGTDVVIAWVPNRAPAGPAGPRSREDRRAATRTIEPDATLEESAGAADPPFSLARTLDYTMPLPGAILFLFAAVHVLLAVVDPLPGRPVAWLVLGYLLITSSAVLVLRPGPMTRPRTLAVLAVALLGALAMYVYLPVHSSAPYTHWHLGAITLVFLVLAARGPLGWAWVGYGILAVLALGWAVANGLSVMTGVDRMIRHAGTLLAGTLFVVGLANTERRLTLLSRQDLAQAAQNATDVAAIDEREAELRRVNALARVTLQSLATPHELTDAERAACLIVEASLRDAIRGRILFIEPVITAVAAARRRGVEVTVIDDSAETPPVELAALAETVAQVIGTVTTGRITVRVLPAGRPDVATLVIDSGTPRLLSVTPAGTLA